MNFIIGRRSRALRILLNNMHLLLRGFGYRECFMPTFYKEEKSRDRNLLSIDGDLILNNNYINRLSKYSYSVDAKKNDKIYHISRSFYGTDRPEIMIIGASILNSTNIDQSKLDTYFILARLATLCCTNYSMIGLKKPPLHTNIKKDFRVIRRKEDTLGYGGINEEGVHCILDINKSFNFSELSNLDGKREKIK